LGFLDVTVSHSSFPGAYSAPLCLRLHRDGDLSSAMRGPFSRMCVFGCECVRACRGRMRENECVSVSRRMGMARGRGVWEECRCCACYPLCTQDALHRLGPSPRADQWRSGGPCNRGGRVRHIIRAFKFKLNLQLLPAALRLGVEILRPNTGLCQWPSFGRVVWHRSVLPSRLSASTIASYDPRLMLSAHLQVANSASGSGLCSSLCEPSSSAASRRNLKSWCITSVW
jgi:hypothetical protein